jgi:predicted nucleic acid-binding protein
MLLVDASVVVRWFTTHEGHERALVWFQKFIDHPDLLAGPDLLRFEVHGALARLAPRRDPEWARRAFDRFQRLGVRMLATDSALFDRALELSATLRIAGYDAVYLAHAEALKAPWLTADQRILRRLGGDARIQAL